MPRTLRELKHRPVALLHGVTAGGKLETRLGTLGITNVLELLEHYPRRYLDRTKRAEIAQLRIGEEATIEAVVRKVSSRMTRGGRGKPLVELVVSDGTSYLYLTFFNQPWRAQQLATGTEVSFYGKLERYRGHLQITNPSLDVVGQPGEDRTGVIVPIYPQSGKADVSTWQIHKLVTEALDRAGEFGDQLDFGVRRALGLVDRTRAYRSIHRPETDADWRIASRRLVFDEFLRMQVGLVARKRAFETQRVGIAH
ncbi:MAG: OB-fold nucleic acid binding domain-containing protein, partial [Acidimicrobiia bacterium]